MDRQGAGGENSGDRPHSDVSCVAALIGSASLLSYAEAEQQKGVCLMLR